MNAARARTAKAAAAAEVRATDVQDVVDAVANSAVPVDAAPSADTADTRSDADDTGAARAEMLRVWRNVEDVARRRTRRIQSGLADEPPVLRIGRALVQLRPRSMTDERLAEQAAVKNTIYQLRRHVWTDLSAEEVTERFMRAFSDPETIADLMVALRRVRRARVKVDPPGFAALKRLAPVSEALRGQVAVPLRPLKETDKGNLELALETAAALTVIERAAADGRHDDASEVVWWLGWRYNDPYFVTLLCAIVPDLRACFTADPPASSDQATFYDHLWMRLLTNMAEVVSATDDRFSPYRLTELLEAMEPVLDLDDLDELLDPSEMLSDVARLADAVAAALPDEDQAAVRALTDTATPRSTPVRFAALAYAMMGLGHAESERRHADQKASLKQQAARALEAEDYARAADLSHQLASLPPHPSPTYRERLLGMAAFQRAEEEAAVTLQAEPATPADERVTGAAEAERQEAERDAARIETLEAELLEAQAQRDEAEAEAARQAALARSAWVELERLKAERAPCAPAPVLERPGTLTDIPGWTEKALAGRLMLHPRAVRGLKKAVFEDVGLLIDVLEMLAGPYRDAKMPGRPEETKEALDARCAELGVEIAPTITSSNKGPSDPQLWINEEGARLLLDTHVRRGIAKDRRVLLRVYFAWDDDAQRVVVGHMPDHIVDKNSR